MSVSTPEQPAAYRWQPLRPVRGRIAVRRTARPFDDALAVSAPASDGCAVAPKRWNELDPRLRQALVIGGAFEAGLKVAALLDLAQRPSDDIRGPKAGWAAAITLVSSCGVVPIMYLLRGRRRER